MRRRGKSFHTSSYKSLIPDHAIRTHYMYFPAALSAETENTDLEDGGMNDRREGEKRRRGGERRRMDDGTWPERAC